uniref:ATP synthase F0 subunit 9 n=1 Tax=Tetraplodon fuegianus TaxID=260168 RepID=A0A0N9Y1H9_9BRYO|nr:ATP synthase F0 subunit 9 [Tetraplodon fuegianus]ALI31055.1 ATP synthase F0 subunit 9 [Tetraplodon fuegianus]
MLEGAKLIGAGAATIALAGAAIGIGNVFSSSIMHMTLEGRNSLNVFGGDGTQRDRKELGWQSRGYWNFH